MSRAMDERQKILSSFFPIDSWFAVQSHCEHFLLWNTFYRRNPHLFVRDYLGIQLHWYQSIILYMMFRCSFVVIIASRASAKSFIIGVYIVVRSILYPNSKVVLTSAKREQAVLILTEKIDKELYSRSHNLQREMAPVMSSQADTRAEFNNGSEIVVVTCNAKSRGHRSTVNVEEESRELDKKIIDEIISPFMIMRTPPYMMLPEYGDDPRLKEEPCDIHISSSVDERHWLYKTAKDARDQMLAGGDAVFIALDYAISLKHGIRSYAQMIQAKRSCDPITWKIEYENAVLRAGANTYFPYDLVKANQVLKRPFYPRKNEDILTNVKSDINPKKQDGEIRIISCDIASIDRTVNDNSVFAGMRLLPETIVQGSHVSQGYRIQVPYLESHRGSELSGQARRIRQLFNDFEADYIVLDVRNAGIAVYEALAKVMYDDERGIEYAPLRAMNDDVLANRVQFPGAKPLIFCFSASARLNSAMAVGLRCLMVENQIDLLVPLDMGVEEIHKYSRQYASGCTDEERLYWESPFIETMMLVNELVELQYDKAEATGLIRVHEKSGAMKDRYSALAMGCDFASRLSRDLINDSINNTYSTVASCVSSVDF